LLAGVPPVTGFPAIAGVPAVAVFPTAVGVLALPASPTFASVIAAQTGSSDFKNIHLVKLFLALSSFKTTICHLLKRPS